MKTCITIQIQSDSLTLATDLRRTLFQSEINGETEKQSYLFVGGVDKDLFYLLIKPQYIHYT